MDHLQRDIQRCPRVAVYGTLKKGCHNHYWLEGGPLLGRDRLTALTLYNLSPYPGAKAEVSAGAVVEVYDINAEQLALMDQLEGYFARAPRTALFFPPNMARRGVTFTTPRLRTTHVSRTGNGKDAFTAHARPRDCLAPPKGLDSPVWRPL